MIISMSNLMHSNLLGELKTVKPKISMIVDTSNDAKHNHYLSVLFQTIEKNRAIIYFYRLIKLRDETCKGMFDVIYNELLNDGLIEVLK